MLSKIKSRGNTLWITEDWYVAERAPNYLPLSEPTVTPQFQYLKGGTLEEVREYIKDKPLLTHLPQEYVIDHFKLLGYYKIITE